MEYGISKDASRCVSDFCSMSLSYYLENTRIHWITFMSICSAHCSLWKWWLPLPSPTFFKPALIYWETDSVWTMIKGQLWNADLKGWNMMPQIFLKNCPPKTFTAWVWHACFRKYFVRSEIFWENLNYLFLSSSGFPKTTFSPYICWAIILYCEKWVTCGRKECFSNWTTCLESRLS